MVNATESYVVHLHGLIRRGRELRDALATDPSSRLTQAAARAWQQACAETVHHLSGGSKAHWLARAHSEAFLIRAARGHVVEEVALTEIVDRIINVLEQAVQALSQVGDGGVEAEAAAVALEAPPRPRRFDFVRNSTLRPVLEQAYADSRNALERRRFGPALVLSCGVLEAIITDALEHLETGGLDGGLAELANWTFETRIAAAERAGLIHGGCARLPSVARKYRDLADAQGEPDPDVTVSERDARLTGQVLHVVMRDLDPGR